MNYGDLFLLLCTQMSIIPRGFIVVSSLLFFLGVLFGYYLITPLSINFLGRYQVSEQVLNEFDIGSYISLVRSSVIACGLILTSYNHLFSYQNRIDYSPPS